MDWAVLLAIVGVVVVVVEEGFLGAVAVAVELLGAVAVAVVPDGVGINK